MPVAASGVLSEMIENFQTLIASNEAFQVWCGLDGEVDPVTATRERVVKLVLDESVVPGVMAMVDAPERFTLAKIAQNTSLSGGNFTLFLRSTLDGLLGDEDNMVTFTNHLGAVMSEMIDESNHRELLYVSQVELVEGPYIVEIQDSNVEYIDAKVTVSYGLRG